MAAWGIRSLENDEAAAWMARFAARPDPAALEAAFDALDEDEGVATARAALAAAEVVAAWFGRPAPEIPPPVTAWLFGRRAALEEALLVRARGAVDRVAGAGELRRRREETGELVAWTSALEELRARLGESPRASLRPAPRRPPPAAEPRPGARGREPDTPGRDRSPSTPSH